MPKKAAKKLKKQKKREEAPEFDLAEAKVYFGVKAKTVIEVVTDSGRKTIDVQNIPEGPKASYEHILNPEYLKAGPPYYICGRNFYHPEEGQINEFFSEIVCKSIKNPGFGSSLQRNDHIFEIDDEENLKKALMLDGKIFNNRQVSIELYDIHAERSRGQRQGYDRGYHGRDQSGYSSSVMDRYKSMMGDDARWNKETVASNRGDHGMNQNQSMAHLIDDWKAQKESDMGSQRHHEERRSMASDLETWKDKKTDSERPTRLSRDQQRQETYNKFMSGGDWKQNSAHDFESRDRSDSQNRRKDGRNQSRDNSANRQNNHEKYFEIDWKVGEGNHMERPVEHDSNRFQRKDGAYEAEESAASRNARYKKYASVNVQKSNIYDMDKWVKKTDKGNNDNQRYTESKTNFPRQPRNGDVPVKILQNPNPPVRESDINGRRRNPQLTGEAFKKNTTQPSVKQEPLNRQKRSQPSKSDKVKLVQHDDGFYGCNA